MEIKSKQFSQSCNKFKGTHCFRSECFPREHIETKKNVEINWTLILKPFLRSSILVEPIQIWSKWVVRWRDKLIDLSAALSGTCHTNVAGDVNKLTDLGSQVISSVCISFQWKQRQNNSDDEGVCNRNWGALTLRWSWRWPSPWRAPTSLRRWE